MTGTLNDMTVAELDALAARAAETARQKREEDWITIQSVDTVDRVNIRTGEMPPFNGGDDVGQRYLQGGFGVRGPASLRQVQRMAAFCTQVAKEMERRGITRIQP